MITTFLTNVFVEKNKLTLDDKDEINHLKNSFRVKKGEKIRGVDGKTEYILEIEEIGNNKINCKILKEYTDRYSLDIELDIALSILNKDSFELAIQKLTELGINKIIPIKTKRSKKYLKEKKERWEKLIKESLKQCQGVKIPVINDLIEIDDIDYSKYDLIILINENENHKYMRDLNIKNHKKILYFVGPEGGFTKEEIITIELRGGKSISLGKRILRAETAAIVAGGLITNEFWK